MPPPNINLVRSPEDVDRILKIATHIKNSKEENKETFFQNKFKVFKAKYPQLYKKICTEADFDMNNLQLMLSMLNRIQRGETKAHDAEAVVGQALFDKYVKPTVAKNEI